MIPWLRGPADRLPDAASALPQGSEAPGLVAAGGDLGIARLAEAYGKGIFPWYSEGQPILWWSPDPRMVLLPAEFKLGRSMQKTLRRFAVAAGHQVRIDTAFDRVIAGCAGSDRGGDTGTWIVPEMVGAYGDWHAAGVAHSVETWIDGELAGGLYGVCLGRMFFGESMFTRVTDASKVALVALVAFCRTHGIETIDCQQKTSHLASFGGREIARDAFLERVAEASARQPIDDWSYDLRMWREVGIDVGPAATDDRAAAAP